MSDEFPEAGTPEAEAMQQRMADQQSGSTEVATQDQPRQVTLNSGSKSVTVAAEELRELSFEALVSALGATDATEAIGTDQYGPILTDKMQLVGKPFVIVHWEFYDGDFGQKFASMWVLTNDNARYIVNDGSTGICQQLRALSDKQGINAMVTCRHGLRVSEYDAEIPDGKGGVKVIPGAKTFYIDTKL